MRYLVKISYDGKNYNGWQIQPNKTTIEGVLERVMSQVLNQPVDLVASGRTDTGVSAVCQIAHFDCDNVIPRGFKGHVNSLLPGDIKVLDVVLTKNAFHARFSAKKKTYKYYFYANDVEIPYYDKFAHHVKYSLNYSTMQSAIKALIGEHDFSSFCSVGGDVVTKTRTIYNCQLNQSGNLYEFCITGNGFLYNMVRIIVGTLVDIGRGKITLDMSKIIESKDRTKAGVTLPAKGLVLFNIEY